MSVSDIKYLKLDTINSEYVSFYLCGNDEQPIKNTNFKKKEFLSKIEHIQREIQEHGKILFYTWLSRVAIDKEIKNLEENTEQIKQFKKLSEFERLQIINTNLMTIKELQDLQMIIHIKFNELLG